MSVSTFQSYFQYHTNQNDNGMEQKTKINTVGAMSLSMLFSSYVRFPYYFDLYEIEKDLDKIEMLRLFSEYSFIFWI